MFLNQLHILCRSFYIIFKLKLSSPVFYCCRFELKSKLNCYKSYATYSGCVFEIVVAGVDKNQASFNSFLPTLISIVGSTEFIADIVLHNVLFNRMLIKSRPQHWALICLDRIQNSNYYKDRIFSITASWYSCSRNDSLRK